MKKFKPVVSALLALVVLVTPVTAHAASKSTPSVRYYTEKEQTSTGIKYGKHYKISTIKIHYSYQDCVKLKKQTASMSGNAYNCASYMVSLIPGYGVVVSGIMGCIGISAGNYNKVFSTAVSKHKGIEISYEYWECTNSASIYDNKTTNYHFAYK